MSKKNQHKWLRKLFGSLSILVILVVLVIFVKQIALLNQVRALKNFASQFGYNSEVHIAQYRRCGGIFPTVCHQVLYFESQETKDKVQTKLNQVLGKNLYSHEIDGYSLLNISIETDNALTINGERDLIKQREFGEPKADEWLFIEGKSKWAIVYYDLENQKSYVFDGKQIMGEGIIEISLGN